MKLRHAAASLAALSVAIATPHSAALADDHASVAAPANDLQELVAQVQVPYEKFELENGLTVIVHEDRKATIVIEHLIQASDVSHTMQ